MAAPAAAAGTRTVAPATSVAWAAAGLSFGAACLHGSVMVTHFREFFLFGLFFAVVTPLQVAWAELVRRTPGRRGLLLAGAAGQGAVAAVWVVSRTAGLPFGPERLEAEAVGTKDVLATLSELLIVALVVVILRRRGAAPPGLVAVAWALAAAGVVLALVGGGGH